MNQRHLKLGLFVVALAWGHPAQAEEVARAPGTAPDRNDWGWVVIIGSIAAGAALIAVLGYQVMYVDMAVAATLCAVSLFVARVPVPEVEKSIADEDGTDVEVVEVVAEPVKSDVDAEIRK